MTSTRNVVTKQSCCSWRRLGIVVLSLLLVGAVGGVLLWRFLPRNTKNAISALGENGVPYVGTGGQTAPPPTYPFIQCDSDPSQKCCNGLPGACSLQIQEIVMAGIHNAHATAQDSFLVAPNHRYSVISALDYGYRAINMDVGVCNGVLSLVHGTCLLGKTVALHTFTAINTWLSQNPTEVLVFAIQIDNEAGGVNVNMQDLYNVLDQAGIAARLYHLVTGEAWPTLGEMVDSDRRVLFFYYNDVTTCIDSGSNCPSGFYDWFAYAAETDFQFIDASDFDNKFTSCAIHRGQETAAFYALNVFLTIPSSEVSATILNTRDFLEKHMASCSTVNNNRRVNIVFIDFWSSGDLPRVVQESYNRKLVLGIETRRHHRHRNLLQFFEPAFLMESLANWWWNGYDN